MPPPPTPPSINGDAYRLSFRDHYFRHCFHARKLDLMRIGKKMDASLEHSPEFKSYTAYSSTSGGRTERLVLVTGLIVFSLVGVVGNSLTILAVHQFRKLHTASYVLVANLAASDLASCVLTMPLLAASMIVYWQPDSAFDRSWLCACSAFVNNVFPYASFHALVVVAFNRFCAVAMPLAYKVRRYMIIELGTLLLIMSCVSVAFARRLPHVHTTRIFT